MPPDQSANPFEYMSPLWTVLLIVGLLAVIAYLILKPLHKYLTDRKTERVLESQRIEDEKKIAESENQHAVEKGSGEG